jgi:hypothetical protein
VRVRNVPARSSFIGLTAAMTSDTRSNGHEGRAGGGADPSESLPARLWRLFWLAVLVAHVVLSGAWWWLEPGGFGVAHPRFWANSVAPIWGLGLAISSLVSLHFESTPALRILLPVWPASWAGAAVAGRMLFPITLEWLWLIPATGTILMVLAMVPLARDAGGGAETGASGLACASG